MVGAAPAFGVAAAFGAAADSGAISTSGRVAGAALTGSVGIANENAEENAEVAWLCLSASSFSIAPLDASSVRSCLRH